MLIDGDGFTNRLRMLFNAYGVTNPMVADYVTLAFRPHVYICRSTLNRWFKEGRVPSFEDAAAISCIFGVSLDWLAGNTDQPYSLSSIAMQEKITAERSFRLKVILGINFNVVCRNNMAARAEALFIYNYLCLKFEEFLEMEEQMSIGECYRMFLVTECDMLLMKSMLEEIIRTNTPYHDLRKVMLNENRASRRVPDTVPPVDDRSGTGWRD